VAIGAPTIKRFHDGPSPGERSGAIGWFAPGRVSELATSSSVAAFGPRSDRMSAPRDRP
jgi:hypothetical protein